MFYKGKVVQIVEENLSKISQYCIVRDGKDLIVVEKTELQKEITDLFTIGERVTSKFGPMEGTVTGFERSTNRVVVQTDKSKEHNDRTRYAYKAKELNNETRREKIQKKNEEGRITFTPGLYLINDTYPAIVEANERMSNLVVVTFIADVHTKRGGKYTKGMPYNMPANGAAGTMEMSYGIERVKKVYGF